jgi:hypothetical protein
VSPPVPDIDAIRERLRAGGWIVTDEWERFVGRRRLHEVAVARGGRAVSGRGDTVAEAWADAERQALGGNPTGAG